jgi:ABC-2 type transport system ATP-binding protein
MVYLVIEVDTVSKTYGSFTALDKVSFRARQGRVTGFLGPNGAGKSTTMRVMVGLTPPTSGTVTIGGHRYADLTNPARHIGTLLDASAQHAGRTGREILALGAKTIGAPSTKVDELLALVGLTGKEAKRRVRHYSLGMRQRLGIAHALLGEPSVLILDEPVNGLDPAGIHWMRVMLRDYAARGCTVLLSSHLLHEVEMIADDIVLIDRGRILWQGAKDDLLSVKGTMVRAVEADALQQALEAEGFSVSAAAQELQVEAEPVEVGSVAARHGITLIELRPAQGAGLEALFLQLTATGAMPAGVQS